MMKMRIQPVTLIVLGSVHYALVASQPSNSDACFLVH